MVMPQPRSSRALPLVYACSGCSNVAQLANDIALELNRRGIAQMSCIAGVGGDVPSLVRTAKSGRYVIGLDGCPLHCVKECLARQAVKPDHHLTLTELGLQKRKHELGESGSNHEALRDAFVQQIAADVELDLGERARFAG